MKKELVVLSLGGSLIIPQNINLNYLKNLKKIILKNKKKFKFVIVCGGGSIARKYIKALKEAGANEEIQSLSGIAATRMNARFLSYFFNQDPKKGIPHKLKQVKEQIKKQDIVFCGALEYHPKETSDSTSAKMASELKSIFINLTNVSGLYNKDPKKYKNAKLIKEISWKNFNKIANKLSYKPGQHFVLDQKASKIIMRNRIKTHIIGENLKNLYNLLNQRKFKGTTIHG